MAYLSSKLERNEHRWRARLLQLPQLNPSLVPQTMVVTWISVMVLVPLAAVVWQAAQDGRTGFWTAVTNPQAVAALKLTFLLSLAVVAINAFTGTLIAWVLVRDSFRGKGMVDAIIDLPFALPTIVAGLTLLALYGPKGPLGVNVAYTRLGVLMALLFVTLPFVVRAVQPVLIEFDQEMEEAAAALGANSFTIFRTIILPNLLPAILSGGSLGFARALGEFGSVVLISGNIPFETQVASVQIFSQIESDNVTGAAAVSVMLLLLSLLILVAFHAIQYWGMKHER